MKYKIRQETNGDEAAIADLTRLAFEGKAYADGDEHELPGRLRAAGALVLSLVAVQGKTIVGHLALSPAKVGKDRFLAVGPVSVHPDRQGRGMGSALVNSAAAVAKAYGTEGLVLTGDPKFYGRLGFVNKDTVTLNGKPSRHLQVMGFGVETSGDDTEGDVQFHAAFET